MKNIKIKNVLLAIVLFSVMSFVNTVDAAGASVYVSPTSTTKTAGDVFNVSVGFNASGNKVCAVEGTLNFKNLSCQNITVTSGVMTQATPTCSNPYFMIGIPNCLTVDKALLTVSVKAGGAGTASISPTGIDVIGEGSSVGSGSIAGNYTINAVVVPVPIITPTTTTVVAPTLKKVTKPVEPVKKVNKTIEETPVQEVVVNNLTASAGSTSSTTGSTTLWVSLIVVVVLGIIYGIYSFKKKSKEGINKK